MEKEQAKKNVTQQDIVFCTFNVCNGIKRWPPNIIIPVVCEKLEIERTEINENIITSAIQRFIFLLD